MPRQVNPDYVPPNYRPNYRTPTPQRTTPARNYNDIWEQRELRQQRIEQQRIEAQRLAAERQARAQVNPKTLLEPYITRQQILAEQRRNMTTNFWGNPIKGQVDVPPEMYGYTPKATTTYYPQNKLPQIGFTSGYRSANPASFFWTNMLSNRRFAGPARTALQMGQMYPFKDQTMFDQSVAAMGLTPRYSSLNPPYRDPWAGDPYEIGGSPYATSAFNKEEQDYGGWGGGGGDYSSSPGIYGESVRRNQWYTSLLQWNIT